MGRRREPGAYSYDYTDGDDRRFADSGTGATLRALHRLCSRESGVSM